VNDKIKVTIAELFGQNLRDVELRPDGGEIELCYSCTITMDKLERLSVLVGTKHINFEFREGQRCYSDLTPGSSSETSIVWTSQESEAT
jgi:hypothetical protein